MILGVLDLSVLVLIIVLLLIAPRLGLTPLELLLAILSCAGAVIGARIWLAVRLRRRAGELF